jgi:DNA-binding MarR family transcriptional regulator
MREIELVELIEDIYRRIMGRITPIALAAGLSKAEALVLWKLHKRGACRVSELATDIGLPPSTLTGVLDRLTAGGWLERDADPEDRRAVVLRSTDQLKEFVKTSMKASSKDIARSLRPLSREHVDRLVADLRAVLECLEGDEGATK